MPSCLEMSQRPLFHLKPRTKPAETKEEEANRSSSIFGSAKPVDTASKEREIEQRLAKDQPKKDDNDEAEEDKTPATSHSNVGRRDGRYNDNKRYGSGGDGSSRGFSGRGRGRGGRGGGRGRKPY